jgi:hypothetical protein
METIIFVILTISLGLFPLQAKADAPYRSAAHDLSIPQASSSRLIATEQEVKEFFDSYVERYAKKDTDGFLWLFSSNALQNQADGIVAIREIYNNFFGQTQTLHCRFEDRKVEIYENAVEVKARYEIEQILKLNGEKKILKGQIRWVLVKEDGIIKILSIDYKHEKTH